jgi:hypothetical protein
VSYNPEEEKSDAQIKFWHVEASLKTRTSRDHFAIYKAGGRAEELGSSSFILVLTATILYGEMNVLVYVLRLLYVFIVCNECSLL